MPATDIEEILPANAAVTTEVDALRTLVYKEVDIDIVIVDGSEALGRALGGPGTVEMARFLSLERRNLTDDKSAGNQSGRPTRSDRRER